MPTLDVLFEFIDRGVGPAPTMEDLETSLGILLEAPVVIHKESNGDWSLTHVRALVDRVGNLRITIRPREAGHNRPHFHVEGPGIDASYALDGCAKLAGYLPANAENKIQLWFERNRSKVIETWNRFHPEMIVEV